MVSVHKNCWLPGQCADYWTEEQIETHPKASLKTRRGVEKQWTSACLKQEEGELERHQRHWVHEKERKRQSGAREEHSVKRSEMLFKQLSWCFIEPISLWQLLMSFTLRLTMRDANRPDQTTADQIRPDKTCPSELKPACWLAKTRDVKTGQTLFWYTGFDLVLRSLSQSIMSLILFSQQHWQENEKPTYCASFISLFIIADCLLQ